MTLLQNSHSPVQISVTASSTAVTNSQPLYANLVPNLGVMQTWAKKLSRPFHLLLVNTTFTCTQSMLTPIEL